MIVMKYRTIMINGSFLFHCYKLLQYLKKLYEPVSVRKSNLKFCTVTSTKDSQQIPKNKISVLELLREKSSGNYLRQDYLFSIEAFKTFKHLHLIAIVKVHSIFKLLLLKHFILNFRIAYLYFKYFVYQ